MTKIVGKPGKDKKRYRLVMRSYEGDYLPDVDYYARNLKELAKMWLTSDIGDKYHGADWTSVDLVEKVNGRLTTTDDVTEEFLKAYLKVT